MFAVIKKLLINGQYIEAEQLFHANPLFDINYIDEETRYSWLMLAINNTIKNETDLPGFVAFMLSHPHFSQINHYHPVIKKTAFDMALYEPVHPEVITRFIEYHVRQGDIAPCLFMHASILSGLLDQLKYEVATQFYQAGIKEHHAGRISDADLARLRAVKDILTHFAVTQRESVLL